MLPTSCKERITPAHIGLRAWASRCSYPTIGFVEQGTERSMRRITIVGAGQAGLHLGIGLVQQGYEVTILSNRTPEQLRDGTVLSSQSMYDMALSLERELGIDFWEDNSPKYRAAAM